MSLASNDRLRFYLRELRTVRPLTKDEEITRLQHMQASDELLEYARKRLIEAACRFALTSSPASAKDYA